MRRNDNPFLFIAVLSLAVGAILVIAVLQHGKSSGADRFQRKNVDGLECVYDPELDRIVACVSATQITRPVQQTLPRVD